MDKGGAIMYVQNYYIGANQLVIVYRDGSHRVLEEYEDYGVVFMGTFGQCLEYCKQRELSYLERIVF